MRHPRHLRFSQLFRTGKAGQGLQEYGLIAGLVVIVAVPALMLMGNQTTGGIDAVNNQGNQLSTMANMLNQAPGGQSLVNNPMFQPEVTSPMTVGGGQAQFRFNPQTGRIEMVVAGPTGGLSSNTTSAEGLTLLRQDLKDFLAAAANGSKPLDRGFQSKLENILGYTSFFADKAETFNPELSVPIDKSPEAISGLADLSKGIYFNAERMYASLGNGLGGGNGSGGLSSALGQNPIYGPDELVTFNPSDLSKPTSIPPALLKHVLDFNNLEPAKQVWVEKYLQLQRDTNMLLGNPDFLSSNAQQAEQLKVNLNYLFLNELLPSLHVDAGTLALNLKRGAAGQPPIVLSSNGGLGNGGNYRF